MSEKPPPEDPDIQLIRDAGEHEIPIAARIAEQRLRFRWIVLILALLAIGCLGWLEYILIRELLESTLNEANISIVVLAISPIVAATTIIAFLLHGIFRGFKDADIDGLPVEGLARGAVEGSSAL